MLILDKIRATKVDHLSFDSRTFERMSDNVKCLLSKPELNKSQQEITDFKYMKSEYQKMVYKPPLKIQVKKKILKVK